MTRKTTLLFLVIISVTSSLSAATRYVSDDLYTYIHSGPGTKYKITGSIDAGERINVIRSNKNAGFSQIKDSKGRGGWINSKYVSRQIGLKERLSKLEINYSKLNVQLEEARNKSSKDKASLSNSLKSHSTEVLELKNTNAALNEKLKQVQSLNDVLNEKLDTEKNELLMKWFSYGGMVAGLGLLFGLILPMMIPRRRNNSRW